jgi:hypothetical protein
VCARSVTRWPHASADQIFVRLLHEPVAVKASPKSAPNAAREKAAQQTGRTSPCCDAVARGRVM